MPKPSPTYGAVAKTLHWLIAAAIVAMLIIGWTMANMDKSNSWRFSLFQFHKSLGITILLLSLFRLYWRLTHPVPPYPAHMAAWEKFAARSTHWLFYILMIGMPLVGWAIVSASPNNLPTMLYGVLPWPHLPVLPGLDLDSKKQIGGVLDAMHDYGAYLLAGLLVLHVAAAHKHHWLDGDDVLTRMAPGPIARVLDRLRGAK
jgi:cytochrome b561